LKREAFSKWLANDILVFDGAMGTALQQRGLPLGVAPETYNKTNPEILEDIHYHYLEAGANVVTINTFGANPLKFPDYAELIKAAAENGKRARIRWLNNSHSSRPIFVALDLGPLGTLIEPLGKLSFDEAYDLFKAQVIAGEDAGCDMIIIETVTDLYEAKCAILAAVENSRLPVVCTMSFETSGRTFFGTDVVSMITTLEGLGVQALGFNCSFGAEEMWPLVEVALSQTTLPIVVQPNAGLPKIIEGITVYDQPVNTFKAVMVKFIEKGVRGLGGCCGTQSDHIKAIRELVEGVDRSHIKENRRTPSVLKTRVASYAQTIEFDEATVVIGERLNPTGKKKLKEALLAGDMDYVMKEALTQVSEGAKVLDINCGVPGADEPALMKQVVQSIQAVLDVPLQIDAAGAAAIEAGARYYNGKPLINSVNGKRCSLDAVLPIAKRYGACLIGLTLDDEGIPSTAEGCFAVAEKIVNEALKIGIPKENLFIDCLVLTASAQQAEVMVTLETIQLVKERLGVKTVLGVSNVSFGLPKRGQVNLAYLTMALMSGLDAAIINPGHLEMMAAIDAFEVLSNRDKGAVRYIAKHGGQTQEVLTTVVPSGENEVAEQLEKAIKSGLKNHARELAETLLTYRAPMDLVDGLIIPTLNEVGAAYEKGTLFLPQLIQAAESVQEVFEVIKVALASSGEAPINRGKVLLATVKHDIHDIGKNIIKVVLANYGYQIVDLGKDVDPERIVSVCREEGIHLVGLSALMTTTVQSMKETILRLRESLPDVKVAVGGAVLSTATAQMIGTDYYGKDAREMVKIAESHFQNH